MVRSEEFGSVLVLHVLFNVSEKRTGLFEEFAELMEMLYVRLMSSRWPGAVVYSGRE